MSGNKWHGDSPDPIQRRPKSNRGVALFWLTALALAISGTVVAIVLYPKSMVAPRFLTMTVREYQSPLLPPNAWTVQDGQLLATHFTNKEEFYDKQNRDQFEKFLTRLENWNEGPVVVQLCALGRVYDNQVVLFLGDADPDQPSRGVPLKKILQSMKGKTTGDRLLLLDLGRPIADARLGILADDLPAAVQSELEKADLPFFVLASCSKGQMSHVSEELGASVFAYQLDLGLRGFADQSGDRRITVTELAAFVKKHVDRWVWINRGQRQEPKLYSNANVMDFPLVQLGGENSTLPETPKEKTYPTFLKAAWKERDALYNDSSYRRAPWAFRQLELAIARAEKRWRSGADDDESRIGPDLAQTVANFKEAIVQANSSRSPRAFGIAELKTPKIDAQAREYQVKFDRYLAKVFEPGVKIGEDDKVRADEVKKIKTELTEELKKLPFETGAAVIVTAAVRPPNLTPGRINALVEMLGEIRQSTFSERRFAETVYLERLKDLIERVLENGDWQGAAAHQALGIALQSEDVLADLGRTPAGFEPWNKGLLVQGENHRRRGDLDLFTGLDFSWKDAQSAYRQADQVYLSIPRRLGILRQCQEQRDRAFLHLPGWAPYLIAAARVNPQEDDAWKGGVLAARGLADLLEREDPSSIDVEPTPLQQWQDNANEWQKAIDMRVKRLTGRGLDGKAAEYLEWNALLESSRFKSEERESIWTAARKLGLKLIETTPKPDATDAEVAALGIVPGDDPTARQEQERKERRVRQTLELLELASFPRVEALDAGEGDPKDAKPLALRLQVTLAQRVPTQFLIYAKIRDKVAEPLAKADRLSRVFPEDLLKRSSGADFNPLFRNPALSLERLHQDAFWTFLRERYQSEAKDLRARKDRHEFFYAEAADAYARTQP